MFGAAVAEAAIQIRAALARRRSSSFEGTSRPDAAGVSVHAQTAPSLSHRAALYLTSIVAGNVPDLDLVLSPLIPGKLGYLLHHRGHTHTLIFALPLALLCLALPWLRARRRAHLWNRGDWGWLIAVAALGPVLHLALDFGNSYGVHPFWPFDPRWYYGDRVFIVEPSFWLALCPALFLASRRSGPRTLWGAIFVAALGLELFSGFVPLPLGAAFAVMGLGLFVALACMGPGRRIAGSGIAALAIMTLYYGAGTLAKERVEAMLASAYPEWRSLDNVMAPMPSNPLCYSLIALQVRGETLTLRRGAFEIFPSFLPKVACPQIATTGTMPLIAAGASETQMGATKIAWLGSAEVSIPELRRMNRERCDVAAFFRFVRVPYVTTTAEGLIVGDLRFDRSPSSADFADLVVDPAAPPCPERVPRWAAPRADLLGE